ncbi:MAG TPA: glycosyltransferase family 4 protein [Chitinophagaceae bacterium]|nr:glycosyltransferase family 4 protein [Chitinophagaceae bacterium]
MDFLKNILLVCTSRSFGGLELNTIRLAAWLREKGWNPKLVVAAGTEMENKAKESLQQVISVRSVNTISKLFFIRRLVKKEKIALLFTPLNKDIAALSLYKRLFNRKIKLIYQQQMLVGVNKKDPVHRFRYAMIDRWICPLDYLKEEVLARTNIPASKIEIIPLGADTARLTKNNIGKVDARIVLDLPQKKRIVGILGRIDPMKGQDTLIKAVAMMKNDPEKNFDVVLMGAVTNDHSDEFIGSLYNMVDESAIRDRVHFRPYNEKIELFYKAIDVFAMASQNETMGMVTLEAMSSGVPVIGTNRAGTAEILERGKLGFLFEPGEPSDFCRAMGELIKYPELDAMIAAARSQVEIKYSKEVMLNKMDVLFRQLLAK